MITIAEEAVLFLNDNEHNDQNLSYLFEIVHSSKCPTSQAADNSITVIF